MIDKLLTAALFVGLCLFMLLAWKMSSTPRPVDETQLPGTHVDDASEPTL